jgi:hypothetical protein
LPQLVIVGHGFANRHAVLQVLIGPGVNHLVERTEFRMPEGAQFGVFLPYGLPFCESIFKFGYGTGLQGIRADFV